MFFGFVFKLFQFLVFFLKILSFLFFFLDVFDVRFRTNELLRRMNRLNPYFLEIK